MGASSRVRELDVVVCPGCGAHQHLDQLQLDLDNGYNCEDCGYGSDARPPTLGEFLVADPDYGDEWSDVAVGPYVKKQLMLLLVALNRLSPSATQTVGLALVSSYPEYTQLMPDLAAVAQSTGLKA